MRLELSKPGRLSAAAALCAGLALPAALFGQSGSTACNAGSPAVPVDEIRTISSQMYEMWPADFQPADPPGVPLPEERDSTGYSGFQRPGREGGLEFFRSLDIVDNAGGTFLFMVYNAGFQIWDIGGAFAANPQLLSQRDGWDGDFHEFESPFTEFYFKIWDGAALDPPGSGDTLLTLAGRPPVGPTIWDASDKAKPFQLYQDTSKVSQQVAVANIGGRSYAFQAATNGVHVYDMTRAREIGPCFESTNTAANLCGGNANPVWRGRLEPWPWGKAQYVDVLEANVGGQTRHFVAVSDEFFFESLGAEIREITDVTSLPPASAAVVEGLNDVNAGVDLFTIPEEASGLDRHYLGTINNGVLEIYDVTACLAPASVPAETCGLGAGQRVFSRQLGFLPSSAYLQFSESSGRPFLYQGHHSLCSEPSEPGEGDVEHLLDLSGLATGGPIVDLRGEEYFQVNPPQTPPVPAQVRIDYWSSYYDKSNFGFSTFAPTDGKFHGNYFYRAAQTIFDIHEWTGDRPPEAQIESTSSGRWLSTPAGDEWVSLSGSCTVGNDTGWLWTGANAPGTPVGDPAADLQNLGGGLARVRGSLCAGDTYPAGRCADRTLLVDADVSCGEIPLSSNQLSVVLGDPRPFFDAISIAEAARGAAPQYPVCQTLDFQALLGTDNAIAGKSLTSYSWEVTPVAGGETLTCNAAAAGTGLSCTEKTLTWNTEGVDAGLASSLFADGFESGNVSRWSSNLSRGAAGRAASDTEDLSQRASKGAAGDGVTFDVTLTADNEHGSIQRATQLTITPLEGLKLIGQGFTIPATPPANGIYSFTATAENATVYRWELEQDASLPGDAGCVYVTPCQIRTTTVPTVQYRWPFQNPAGVSYDVWLEISNCDVNVPPIAVRRTVNNVVVVEPDPPTITSLRVVTGSGCSCIAIAGGKCSCPVGNVDFTLAYDGTCDDLTLTWGDGNTSSGLACDQPTYSHNYTAEGTYTVQAEACFGPDCDTQVNLTNLSSPVPLTIE